MNTWLYSPDRIGLVHSSNNPTCLKTLFQTRPWVLKDRMLYKLNCNYESNQSLEDKEIKTDLLILSEKFWDKDKDQSCGFNCSAYYWVNGTILIGTKEQNYLDI